MLDLTRTLWVILLALHGWASAQGNQKQQEKGDLLFRDLNIPLIGFINMHNAVYWQYNGGDPPNDTHNSSEIEMLGGQTNQIIDETVYLFTQAAPYHGAFGHPCSQPQYYCPFGAFTRLVRLNITQTARNMELRQPLIVYVSTPTIEYLDYSGGGNFLTLNNITKMRSDAVTEYAYTANGFPIIHPYGNTIITNPNLFIKLADSLLLGLKPSDQQAAMIPAVAVNPIATVYDANGNPIFSGGASSMTTITVNVFDQDSGPGGLELWQGSADTGVLLSSNTVAFNSTSHLYTSADTGLSGLSGIANGQYTIRAIDQAGNVSVQSFNIDRTNPAQAISYGNGTNITSGGSAVGASTWTFVSSASALSGISTINLTGPGVNQTAKFSCAPGQISPSAQFGSFANLSAGNYVFTSTSCAGNGKQTNLTITNGGAPAMVLYVNTPSSGFVIGSAGVSQSQVQNNPMTVKTCFSAGGCANCDATHYLMIVSAPTGTTGCDGATSSCCRSFTLPAPAQSTSFSISNTTNVATGNQGEYDVSTLFLDTISA